LIIRKIIKIIANEMSHFKAKMHQIRFLASVFWFVRLDGVDT